MQNYYSGKVKKFQIDIYFEWVKLEDFQPGRGGLRGPPPGLIRVKKLKGHVNGDVGITSVFATNLCFLQSTPKTVRF